MLTYLVTCLDKDLYAFLIDGSGKTVEIHRHERDDEDAHTGEIYIGRVAQVVPSLEAAFVDIGTGRNAYLPFDQLKAPVYTKKGSSPHIQQGDELLVQVIRDAVKTKAAALSTQLTMRGRYCALHTGAAEKGISRKIAQDRRTELRGLLSEPLFDDMGLILRTNAQEAADEEIRQEYLSLSDHLHTLIREAAHKQAPCLLLSQHAWLRHFVDLPTADVEQILIDREDLYAEALSYLAVQQPAFLDRLHRYDQPLQSMAKAWSLEERVAQARQRKVYLRSGAYLLIEPTETLTAIDVNTGKLDTRHRKHSREETFFRVNLEAAQEVAVQLRLRGISGAIIVDFISMEEEQHKKELLVQFSRCLASDPVPTRVIDMTGLGLVEVTRRRGEKPL